MTVAMDTTVQNNVSALAGGNPVGSVQPVIVIIVSLIPQIGAVLSV